MQNGVGNEEAIAEHVAARHPRHDLPRREDPRARPRAVGRQGRHHDRPLRAAAGADGRGRAPGGRVHAGGDADPRRCGRARAAVAQADLQRGHQSGRGTHRPHSRPRLRGPGSPPAGQRARRRGEGRRGRAGHRAGLRPRGADRLRRPAGGGVRPQGEHAPGRRGSPRVRDRLPERRHRALRQRGTECRRR